jgi:hypothetical protein
MVVSPSAITCYVDASTNPDNGQPSPRRAGLGIFIVNLQVQPANYIYIRVSLQETHSVISAEAAAIALAAIVLHRMDHHLQETHSVISAEAAAIALAAIVLHRMDHHQVSFL